MLAKIAHSGGHINDGYHWGPCHLTVNVDAAVVATLYATMHFYYDLYQDLF